VPWSTFERVLSLLVQVGSRRPDAIPRDERRHASAAVAAATADALTECLLADHGHWALHEAAIEAMPSFACRGDRRVVVALAKRLEDVDEQARVKCLDALEQLAGKGDQAIVAALSPCLTDRSDAVRRSAIAAWRAVVVPGSQACLTAARQGLSSESAGLRAIAASALGAAAASGDPDVVAQLTTLIQDKEPLVRDAALDAMGVAAGRDSPAARAAVGPLMLHKSWSVRQRALLAFARLAPVGDAEAVKAIAAKLEDSASGVRAEVPAALALLVEGARGHPIVVAEVCEWLSSRKPWPVRQAAVSALGRTAVGDKQALTAAAALVSDEAKGVREQATIALEALFSSLEVEPPSNVEADVLVLELLTPSIAHRDPQVRISGLNALAKLAPLDSCGAFDVAKARLSDSSWFVREKALFALARISGPKQWGHALEIAGASLEDPNDAVRMAAAQGLILVAEAGGDLEVAVGEARCRLDHAAHGVRRAASVAFSKLQALQSQMCKQEVNTEDESGSKRAVLLDKVGSGLRMFLKEAKAESVTGATFHSEAGRTSVEDDVGLGLKHFLLEHKRHWGPVCALKVFESDSSRKQTGGPLVSASHGVGVASIFRPPSSPGQCAKKEEEEEEEEEEMALASEHRSASEVCWRAVSGEEGSEGEEDQDEQEEGGSEDEVQRTSLSRHSAESGNRPELPSEIPSEGAMEQGSITEMCSMASSPSRERTTSLPVEDGLASVRRSLSPVVSEPCWDA